jgi:hypothetical protein
MIFNAARQTLGQFAPRHAKERRIGIERHRPGAELREPQRQATITAAGFEDTFVAPVCDPLQSGNLSSFRIDDDSHINIWGW